MKQIELLTLLYNEKMLNTKGEAYYLKILEEEVENG